MTARESCRSGGRDDTWRTLAELSVPSEPGNERRAAEEVSEALRELGLPEDRLQKLRTAVAEATMNAMEHGNGYAPEKSVEILARASGTELVVSITDQGAGPPPDPELPDIEAKLEGLQTPRGWGLFLIRHMVDEMHVSSDGSHHTVTLVLSLRGEADED